MLLLLVLPDSLVVLSCDVLIACAYWKFSCFKLWCSSCLWFLSHSFCFFLYVMFLLLLLAIQWFQAMMFLFLVVLGSLVALSCDVLLAFAFTWCSCSCSFNNELTGCKCVKTCPFAHCFAIAACLAAHCTFVVNPRFTPQYLNGHAC